MDSLNASTGKELPWLNGFIKEVQRLSGPVNTLVPRVATQDLLLLDLPVDRGTCVLPLFDFNHTSAKYYLDPFSIRPERWFNGETDLNEPYTFVPFSAGSRNCIGQHLAMLEARLILIHFLTRFTYGIKQPFRPIANNSNVFDFFSEKFCV